jgi:hypothetical protein
MLGLISTGGELKLHFPPVEKWGRILHRTDDHQKMRLSRSHRRAPAIAPGFSFLGTYSTDVLRMRLLGFIAKSFCRDKAKKGIRIGHSNRTCFTLGYLSGCPGCSRDLAAWNGVETPSHDGTERLCHVLTNI